MGLEIMRYHRKVTCKARESILINPESRCRRLPIAEYPMMTEARKIFDETKARKVFRVNVPSAMLLGGVMLIWPSWFWGLLGIPLGEAIFPVILYGSVIFGVGLASIAGALRVQDPSCDGPVGACHRPIRAHPALTGRGGEIGFTETLSYALISIRGEETRS